MKNSFLILSLIFFSTYGFTQSNITLPRSQTTMEEYNYMCKGYPYQISAGLDMKKGYEVDQIDNIKISSYDFYFQHLYRIQGNKIDIGIIIRAHSGNSGKDYWYCFPYGNDELMNDTFNSVSVLDEPMTTAFFRAFAIYQSKIK